MKLAIIGKGTAGSLAINHFSNYTDLEIDCYFNSNIKEQSVGEGSTVDIPTTLQDTINFSYTDYKQLDATIKTGISYVGWGSKDYFHSFTPPYVSMHFNAIKLQEFLQHKNKKRFKFIEKNIVDNTDIDADYVIDCSGSPKKINTEYMSAKYIPVNKVLLKQLSIENTIQNYTMCVARPHGWIFVIPLINRISFGYLHNKTINSEEEIHYDLNKFMYENKYETNNDYKTLDFNNYYRKYNFDDNLFYNGNVSFFTEPMEATSLATVDMINRKIYDVIYKNSTSAMENLWYTSWFKQVQHIITLHYFAKSKYDTEFWDYAYKLAHKCMKNFSFKNKLLDMLDTKNSIGSYGTWDIDNFSQNIKGLDIEKKLRAI